MGRNPASRNPSSVRRNMNQHSSHYPPLSEDDVHLFNEGTHFRLYEKLGAHCIEQNGKKGVHFAVWAPNAASVSVMGEFNDWNKSSHPLQPFRNSGIWQGFIPNIGSGEIYKYFVSSRHHGY